MIPKTTTINGTERVPVNKTARIVTSPANEYDLYPLKPNAQTFEYPLKTKAVPRYLEDLTGSKRGKMTIVGYIGYTPAPSYNRNNKHPPHKWLAKCICGKYEKRDGYLWRKGLRNNKTDDGCTYCNKAEQKRQANG